MPNSDDITRSILNKLRALQEMNGREGNLKSVLNEAIEDNSSNAIAITDDPAFGQNVLTNQIQQFRSIVESGAQFAKVDESNVSECPLIYMPDTGNLVFSGVIPCLNNM